MRKHETAVCGTARTVVWEVGKCENRRQIPFMISIYLLPNFFTNYYNKKPLAQPTHNKNACRGAKGFTHYLKIRSP